MGQPTVPVIVTIVEAVLHQLLAATDTLLDESLESDVQPVVVVFGVAPPMQQSTKELLALPMYAI